MDTQLATAIENARCAAQKLHIALTAAELTGTATVVQGFPGGVIVRDVPPLQPCLYCGSGSKHVCCRMQERCSSTGTIAYFVQCSCCGLRTPAKGTLGRAIDVWNNIAMKALAKERK